MTKKILLKGFFTASSILLLAACSPEDTNNQTESSEDISDTLESSEGDEEMVHDESGEIPEGLEVAENPMYQVGESVILQNGHMSGMEGAEATIVGVFDTTAYEVSFDPTDGGEVIENHKWLTEEELAPE